MPNQSEFLKLVLPLYGEFVDAWDQVMDQNFELLDDHLAELRRALLTGTPTAPAGAAYAGLVGTKSSLANRLNVAINPDGTLNLDNSPALGVLGSSSTNGDLGAPRVRFDATELEIWNARSPLPSERFLPVRKSRGLLDDGVALRARLGQSGLVAGPEGYLSSVGARRVKLDATLTAPESWPVFNIDGYVFRIREAVLLDLTTDAMGAVIDPGDVVWLYVERGDYGNPNLNTKLATDAGPMFSRDLRRLQTGSDGVISGKSLSSSSASFQGSSYQWTILPGDLLVIDDGPAKGSYVIDQAVSPDTVSILGTFRADGLSGVPWHIQDDFHPQLGCIKVADATTEPPVAEGRVYIGRGQLGPNGLSPVGGAPLTKIAFAKNGTYDSGWLNVSVSSFPMSFEHNLGGLPSSVEVWVRDGQSGESFPPMALRPFVVDFDTTSTTVTPSSAKKAMLRVPSMHWHSTRQRTQVHLSASAPNVAPALFTKEDDATQVTAGQIRLIARR